MNQSSEDDVNAKHLKQRNENNAGWIPVEQLGSFGEYKYVSPKITYFEEEILNRFWDFLIQFMPR